MQQVGSAADLYRRPATRFVAGFVGRSTALRGTVETVDGEAADIRIGNVAWRGTLVDAVEPGQPADLVVRPEALALVDNGPTALAATVDELRFTGLATYALLRVDGQAHRLQVLVDDPPSPGDTVYVVLREPASPIPRVFPPEDA